MKKAGLIISSAIVLACLLTACGQKPATGTGAIPATADTTKKFTLAMVVNKKDPSCGMPLTAGIGDTAVYKGAAYGFCSKECKNEFLKNPEGYLAKLK